MCDWRYGKFFLKLLGYRRAGGPDRLNPGLGEAPPQPNCNIYFHCAFSRAYNSHR